MTETSPSYRVRLRNIQTIGASCGYGVGDTLDEAIAEALEIARQLDPTARYSHQDREVLFCGGINC